MKAPKQKLTKLQKTWIAALRSGKYQQGTARLQVGKNYCCLGVACRVAIAAGARIKVRKVTGLEERMFDEAAAFAPPAVVDLLGLRNDIGAFGSRRKRKIGSAKAACLTGANDCGASFSEIADFIEANPEQVFLPPTKRKGKAA